MTIKLKIPESLNEITLGQYQEWVKITEGQEINNFYQQKMICLLYTSPSPRDS